MDGDSTAMGMALTAFFLGARHGFDLDHLATVDAITRATAHHRRLSKMVGCLFSLGHGLVVTAVSLLIGSGLLQGHTPQWLDGFGSGISIFFLFLFGLVNLRIALKGDATVPALSGYLSAKMLSRVRNPIMVMAVGMLFAFSFDTISQVALFAMAGAMTAGWLYAGVLGLCFTIGMMSSDGVNGLVVAKLLCRADATSKSLSRGLGFTISLFSIGTGTLAVLQWLLTID